MEESQSLGSLADGQGTDICRVCRAEGTPTQPLFYPCLCSGSIKYVHQECLIEWLQHSKKKYCELCKHPYTFSAIYEDKMPERLPVTVILLGMLQYLWGWSSVTIRYCYLFAVWLLFMPVLTSTAFWSLFGFDGANNIPESMWPLFCRIFVGLTITTGVILLSIGLLLLKDYLVSHRLFRVRRRRRERNEMRLDEFLEDDPIMNNLELQDADVHTARAQSETTVRTTNTRHTSKSVWLNDVTPREYRAYRRRKELYKERVERFQNPPLFDLDVPERSPVVDSSVFSADEDHHRSLAGSTSNYASVSNADASITKMSVNNSQMDSARDGNDILRNTATSHDKRKSRDHAKNESLHQSSRGAGTSSNVSFRDNIRCKICSSFICIDKEHVIKASRQSSGNRLFNNLPLDDLTESESPSVVPPTRIIQDEIHTSANTNVPETRANPDNVAEMEEPWILFGFNMERDNNTLSLSEFLGFTGSLISVFQNALVIALVNFSVTFLLLFLPLMFGRTLLAHFIPYLSSSFGYLMATSVYSHIAGLMITSRILISSTLQNVAFYSFGINTEHWLGSIALPVKLSKALILYDSGSPMDFLIQVGCGYLCIVLICACYKMIIMETFDKLEGFHYSLLHLFNFLGAFLKLTLVVITELIFFPIYCGWLVDISLLPLFKSTVDSRIDFYNEWPYVSQTIHWVLGTIVLVLFSLFIKWCRGVFRPGLLYFIRNSDDETNLPMKDIVDRPVHQQIVRLLNSAILYAVVLITYLYGFSIISKTVVPNLIPLNFDFLSRLSSFHYDLYSNLFIHTFICLINGKTVGKLVKLYLRNLLRVLRLSSYFYGGRYLSEESLSTGKWVFLPDSDRLYKPEKVRAMFTRKVEPVDVASVPIIEGRRESSSTPLRNSAQRGSYINPLENPSNYILSTPEPRRPRRYTQIKAKHPSTKGFTVVYRPSFCKTRVLIFLFALCLFMISLGMIVIIAPILVGRKMIFTLISNRYLLHDLHNFQIGIIILGSILKVLQVLFDFLQDQGTQKLYVIFIKIPATVGKIIIMAVFFGCIYPLVVGIYVSLTLLPLLLSTEETPVIPLIMCWPIGIACTKALFIGREFLCAPQRRRVLDRLATVDGWINMNIYDVLIRLALPYSLRLLLFIAGPPVAVLLIAPVFNLSPKQFLLLQRLSYILSLVVPMIAVAVSFMIQVRRHLAIRIRDENYLVGRRLLNLEQRPLVN